MARSTASFEHRQGETGEFEIELESSDSFGGAAKFEVHIAEVVFAANDVGQHLVTEHFRARGIELGHESDTDARNGGFEGDASVEGGQGCHHRRRPSKWSRWIP